VGVGGRRRPHLVVLGAVALVLSTWAGSSEAWAATKWVVSLGAGSSGHAQAQALPVAPSGVTSSCNAPTTTKVVKVTWSAVAHATNYAVYQATSTTATPGTYTKLTTVTTTSYTSGTLTAGTNYWYKVVTDIGTNWAGAQSAATAERTINAANPFCV